MIYNFYLFIILISIFNAVTIFLKKNILKTISVSEEMLFSSMVIFISTLTYYLFFEGKNKLSKFIDKIRFNKNNVTQELLLFDLLILGVIVLAGNILINEKIVYSESIKIAVYLILIALLSCIFKNIMNIKILFGIFFLIIGIFLLENQKLESKIE